MSKPRTDRLGLAKLEYLFGSIGWLFREQFIEDIGIDAQVEICENDISTGQIIAIQIKTGESYFSEQNTESVIYRPDITHVEYWLKYSIPVIIILYNPNNDLLLWSPVHESTLTKTKINYKIEISKSAILTKENYKVIKKIYKLNYPQNRFTKLLLDYPWMQLIHNGETVHAEFEGWVNKSLTRTSVKIYCNSKNGYKESIIPQYYSPGYDLWGLILKLIPWAEFEMDIDSYREYMEEQYENNCSYYDKEDGETYYTELFDDYYEEPDEIVPIRTEPPINIYSVILKLNDLGKAFIKIAEYLYDDPTFEFTSFSVNELLDN